MSCFQREYAVQYLAFASGLINNRRKSQQHIHITGIDRECLFDKFYGFIFVALVGGIYGSLRGRIHTLFPLLTTTFLMRACWLSSVKTAGSLSRLVNY